ncbi:AraC family transcriptional regulator [Paenibacillus lycopersici]|uniref:AraC family transcriptional regulator n=1 Tax=Paenibacillus lycopersici TaxID=2704462 RepID=A0A6C0FNV6_9BACL|nr:AraC family transcriptional regulator [Paenibacillus lycopersici]QHT58567.1 AraC family transcriptional regulator [Paenibacillus lycopersici]
MNANQREADRETQIEAAGIDGLTARLWDVEIVTGVTRIEPQLTSQDVLIVLLSGAGTLIRDRDMLPMRPDTVYCSPGDSTFGIEGTSGDHAVAVIRMGLYRAAARDQSRLVRDREHTAALCCEGVALAQTGRASNLCRTMKEQHGHEDPVMRWRAQLTLQELLFELFSTARRPSRSDSRDALEQARRYMDEHYREELSIKRLAGVAELSPNYFADLFKRHYGVSAMDYVTQLRMAKAKKLLVCSDMRLKDIAHEVGYEDEFYFSRKFRKAEGVSPSAFIKKRRNKLAVYGSASILGYLMPLQVVPFAAPLHPKWAGHYYSMLGSDITVHLDAFRQNQHKTANLQRLAEARPDLILCPAGVDAKERAVLSGIAEVYEMPKPSNDWRAGLRTVAERLGERAEAERWLEAYERKVLHVREEAGDGLNQTVLTVRLYKNQFYAYCNSGMADMLFGSLGLQFPYAGARFPFDRPLSIAELDEAGADRILLLVCQETETLEGWKALQQSPEWMSLHAVRGNRVRIIPSDPWREYSPSAIERMLGSMPELLTGKRPSLFGILSMVE